VGGSSSCGHFSKAGREVRYCQKVLACGENMQDRKVDEKAGHDWLEGQGFQIRAVLDPECFPSDLREAFASLGIEYAPGVRLVVLAMGGALLWDRIEGRIHTCSDPFDSFSIEAAHRVSKEYWGCDQIELLYPGPLPIPLQRLGQLAGCSYPSPLGLDLHPVYGPWFAYRVAFLIGTELQLTEPGMVGSPCEGCADRPCVAACPASAVAPDHSLDLERCIAHRLVPRSGCTDRCQSRLMCPVGRTWQYSEAQLRYHGDRSRESLMQWAQVSRGPHRSDR